MKKLKAFTLLEILIVLVITGMLFAVLFRVYITISQITFRVQEQKYVNEELLFLSESLQNFSNRNKIDYSKYWTWLFDTSGFTDILYMNWEDWEFSLYSSGVDCESGICNLYISKDWVETQISKNKIYFSKSKFKIIPFEPVDYTRLSECETLGGNAYACRNNPWFWFMVKIYSSAYSDQHWTNNVYMDIQQFFNN